MKGRGCAAFSKMKRVEQEESLFYDWEISDPMANQIKAYSRISWRCVRESEVRYLTPINGPDAVCELLNSELDMENLDREYFVAIYLDRKGNVNAYETISIGSLDSTIVHPREVFKTAILTSSASIILAHNHPSGDPTPSKEDLNVTRRLVEVGELIGISVIDHVIIGHKSNMSLKEKGYI